MATEALFWNPDYTKYSVIDMETTVKAPSAYKFSATPAFKHNKIVAVGIKRSDMPYDEWHMTDGQRAVDMENTTRILVGHNIKFDLGYTATHGTVQLGAVWDTGIAHYMMTGQKARMPSLNEVAEFYGLGQKKEGVKDLWDMGMQTENIEKHILMDYLKQDVMLTEAIYLKQQERLQTLPKLREHILRVSTASTYIAACEYNGLPVSWYKLHSAHSSAESAAKSDKVKLYEYAEERYKVPLESRELWDPTTPSNVGKLLFDLPLEIQDFEPAGRVLKNGQVAKRRRKIDFVYNPPEDEHHKNMASLPVPRTKSGQIQTSDDLLDLMVGVTPVTDLVRGYRSSSKLYSTYMKPSMEFVLAAGEYRLLPTFHLTTTVTGRSSSSGPNAQQLPPELEACITARVAGEFIVKADFKQLQICGVAMLSKDPQLIDDLNNGRDVHFETGKSVFGWTVESDMNKEDRRIVKNTNFGLIFGGKAAGIARQTGVDKKIVQQCIDAFYSRYPGVKTWVDKNIQLVETLAVPAENEFINGAQVREAYLQTPAGRVLRFTEHEAPEWVQRKTGKSLAFSPNEIANYPVQAYTDGDLALIYLAILGTASNPVFTPINFVHDSVWVLTKDPQKTKVQLLEALDTLNTKMGLSVPLKLDFTVEDHEGNKVP